MRTYDAKVQRDMDDLRTKVGEVADKTTELEKQSEQFNKDIQELRSSLAVAERTVPPPPPEAESWNRAPDHTILRLNTREPAYKGDVAESIKPWLTKNFKAGEFEIAGPDVEAGKNFTIKFTGATGLAATRARKALGTLKNADGQWENQFTKVAGEEESNNQIHKSRAGCSQRSRSDN